MKKKMKFAMGGATPMPAGPFKGPTPGGVMPPVGYGVAPPQQPTMNRSMGRPSMGGMSLMGAGAPNFSPRDMDSGMVRAFKKGGVVKESKMGKYSKMEMEHVAQMKKHGVPKKFVKQEEKEAMGMKKGGMAGCYAEGGAVKKPYKPSDSDLNDELAGKQEMQERKDAAAKNRMRGAGRGPLSRNGMKDNPFGYAKGGMVGSRGDGCVTKGKTKGRMC